MAKRVREDVVSDMDALNLFLQGLEISYDAYFTLSTGAVSYYDISDAQDKPASELSFETKVYPDGEYVYIFKRDTTDATKKQIPDVIEFLPFGAYGAVKLRQPIIPSLLPSYALIPYRIPSSILVQLAFSVLQSIQKEDFKKDIMANAITMNDAQMGDFVRKYLTSKSVSIDYFFGNMRPDKYGEIFRKYGLGESLGDVVIEEEVEQKGAPEKLETLLQAEDLILNILQTI